MTPGDPAADLGEVLRTLCTTQDLPAVELLGDVRPSELSVEFVRVEPTRFAAFRAIEVKPWSEAGYGIALPELADGASWSLPPLERMLGGLEEGPRTQGLGPQLQGFLDDAALPARGAVYVVLATDDPASAVAELRARIEAR
jgi:hypothetical protein